MGCRTLLVSDRVQVDGFRRAWQPVSSLRVAVRRLNGWKPFLARGHRT